jgi:hypothetical protein
MVNRDAIADQLAAMAEGKDEGNSRDEVRKAIVANRVSKANKVDGAKVVVATKDAAKVVNRIAAASNKVVVPVAADAVAMTVVAVDATIVAPAIDSFAAIVPTQR